MQATKRKSKRSDAAKPAASRTADVSQCAISRNAAWWRTSFAYSLASGLLLWAALPPLGWWPLGWVAPLFWLLLIRAEKMPGKRPYWGVWAGGVAHWILVMQGVRLAHWANHFGLVAMSSYLALYFVLFVGLTRVAVHRWRLPLVVCAPVVWTGLELARGHALTGFSMALLAHTQVSWVALIQLCDIFGAYGVSFVLMLFAAGLVQMAPLHFDRQPARKGWSFWPLIPMTTVVLLALGYGQYRMHQPLSPDRADRAVEVALIQGSFDTVFDGNAQRHVDAFYRYFELSLRAREQRPDLDLIVWPESVFSANVPELVLEPGATIPADDAQGWITTFQNKTTMVAEGVNTLAENGELRRLQIQLVLGTEAIHHGADGPRLYNSALLVSPAAELQGRYYKMHPVMFGEYVPLGDVFPALYRLTPMQGGLSRGRQPTVFQAAGLKMSPNICFESTVPHLIRRQVAELRRQGDPPDLLLNITNDGGVWGSSILDLHLHCAVFRAVENRLPLLVAANTGFSAWIDGNGSVLQQGPRRAEGTLFVQAAPDGRSSWYGRYGDWPAGLCLAFCGLLALAGLPSAWQGWRRPSPPAGSVAADNRA